ncbi:hypothetical protein RRG08_018058 [Elysia crispata]|uniref:Uncharacterized protein n=1 Tax=Elysia crispata TaxID=231223 RepID=A0AAE1DF63_9GAST|nr:hypothetical protein RRG08_018058 [Elysia crispata]
MEYVYSKLRVQCIKIVCMYSSCNPADEYRVPLHRHPEVNGANWKRKLSIVAVGPCKRGTKEGEIADRSPKLAARLQKSLM